jgi:hypothetical protein
VHVSLHLISSTPFNIFSLTRLLLLFFSIWCLSKFWSMCSVVYSLYYIFTNIYMLWYVSLQSEYPKYTPLLAKILEGLVSRSNIKDKIRHDEEVHIFYSKWLTWIVSPPPFFPRLYVIFLPFLVRLVSWVLGFHF